MLLDTQVYVTSWVHSYLFQITVSSICIVAIDLKLYAMLCTYICAIYATEYTL